MSDFYDDDSSETDIVTVSDAGVISLQIAGYDAKAVMERVAQLAVAKYAAKFEQRIEEACAKAVEAAVDDEIRTKIAAVVGDILAEGWHETNPYGVSNGRKVTVRDRIEHALKPDPYRSGSGLSGIVDKTIKDRFDRELSDGVKRIKSQIDEVIQKRIVSALASTLGIKTEGAA